MLVSRSQWVRAALLCLGVQQVLAFGRGGGAALHGRADVTAPAAEETKSISSTTIVATTTRKDENVSATSDASSSSVSSSSDSSDVSNSASDSSSASLPSKSSTQSSTTSSTIFAATSDIVGAVPTSSTKDDVGHTTFNTSATPDKLPITPEITPGWGVAGSILLLTGLAYASVGIKRTPLQVYVSAAYLASLAVTVLIVYVMQVPVSNGVQGGYVVAVVLTGAIIGGAAIFFKDMTEGLGCLLGGFTFSMWLLTLKRGGLIHSTSGKAILISILSLAGFATSFHRSTRPYGLMASTAFGGATAVVLGIDCFSRAGLKEFWAWIWNVNDDLFPLGATSYPLTKGIKVEIAAIIVLFLAGVVSQVKLWKLVKERRERRAKQLEHFEHATEQQEAALGRRIEFQAAQDRVRWERVYAEKDAMVAREESLQDSGFGDNDSQSQSQRKGGMVVDSTATSIGQRGDDSIEMAVVTPTSPMSPVTPISPTDGTRAMAGPGSAQRNDRRVSRDSVMSKTLAPARMSVVVDSPAAAVGEASPEETPATAETTWLVGGIEGEARLGRTASQRSKRKSLDPVRTSKRFSYHSNSDGPKSPIPDIEVEEHEATATEQEPRSPIDVKRLSVSSARMLRKISTRSKRSSCNFEKLPDENDELSDSASSVAATLDEDDRYLLASKRLSWNSVTSSDQLTKDAPSPTDEVPAERVEADDVVESDAPVQSTDVQCDEANKVNDQAETTEEGTAKDADLPPSAPLILESLPPRLPKIALDFRTNEWAKHIPTDIEPPQQSPIFPTTSDHDSEVVAPVDVVALQQTGTDANPRTSLAPTAQTPSPRSSTQTVPTIQTQTPSRLSTSSYKPSRVSLIQQTSPSHPGQTPSPRPSMVRPGSVSVESLRASRQSGLRASSAPFYTHAITESPNESRISVARQGTPSRLSVGRSPTPGNGLPTLLEQRDSIIKQKRTSIQPSQLRNSQIRSASAGSFLYAHPSQWMGGQANTPNTVHSIIAEEDCIAVAGNDDDEGDNISLSARRDMLRRSKMPPPDPSTGMSGNGTGLHGQGIMTGGRRVSGLGGGSDPRPSQSDMDRKLASFRASVQEDRAREGERKMWGVPEAGVWGGRNSAMSVGGNGMPMGGSIPPPFMPSYASSGAGGGGGTGIIAYAGTTGMASGMGTMLNNGSGAGGFNAERHREALRRLQSKAS